jgi:hypothetical protein
MVVAALISTEVLVAQKRVELGCMPWIVDSSSSPHVACIGENTYASITLTRHGGTVFDNIDTPMNARPAETSLVQRVRFRFFTIAVCEFHSLTYSRLVC